MKPEKIEIFACLALFIVLSAVAALALITGELTSASPRDGQLHYFSGNDALFVGGFLLALAFAAAGYACRYLRFHRLVWLGLGLLWGAMILLAWSQRAPYL